MALRKQKQARSKTTLPPQLAAATLHAAGIDVGAEAHDVAVPPVMIPNRCAALPPTQPISKPWRPG